MATRRPAGLSAPVWMSGRLVPRTAKTLEPEPSDTWYRCAVFQPNSPPSPGDPTNLPLTYSEYKLSTVIRISAEVADFPVGGEYVRRKTRSSDGAMGGDASDVHIHVADWKLLASASLA